jgi:hypothetical protein
LGTLLTEQSVIDLAPTRPPAPTTTTFRSQSRSGFTPPITTGSNGRGQSPGHYRYWGWPCLCKAGAGDVDPASYGTWCPNGYGLDNELLGQSNPCADGTHTMPCGWSLATLQPPTLTLLGLRLTPSTDHQSDASTWVDGFRSIVVGVCLQNVHDVGRTPCAPMSDRRGRFWVGYGSMRMVLATTNSG